MKIEIENKKEMFIECKLCYGARRGQLIVINGNKYHLGCIDKLVQNYENTIEFCEDLLNNKYITINDKTYYKHECDDMINYYIESIESIVTKEQFESMSYKVGE